MNNDVRLTVIQEDKHGPVKIEYIISFYNKTLGTDGKLLFFQTLSNKTADLCHVAHKHFVCLYF